MDFDSPKDAQSDSDTGTVIVMDNRTLLAAIARFSQVRASTIRALAPNLSTQFYEYEACGQCTPCREGTTWRMSTPRPWASARDRHAPGTDVRARPITFLRPPCPHRPPFLRTSMASKSKAVRSALSATRRRSHSRPDATLPARD